MNKIILSATFFSALATSAFAYQPMQQVNQLQYEATPNSESSSMFGLGLNYDSKIGTVIPMFQADMGSIELGLGYNYRSKGATDSGNYFAGYYGWKAIQTNNFSVAIGGMGDVMMTHAYTKYDIGPYVGADYYLTPHIKASAKLMILDWQQEGTGTKNFYGLSQGTLGMSYMF